MTAPYVRPEYPHSATTAKIIAAAKAVQRALGPGVEEVIYQRALALELAAQGLHRFTISDCRFTIESRSSVHHRKSKIVNRKWFASQ